MPIYDRACEDGHTMLDLYEKISHEDVPCKTCGKTAKRVILGGSANVIGDDIPGGIWMEHGVCNEDGTPRKYYSKSEIAKEAKRRGLTNVVRHVPTDNGTDKAKHTVKWY